MDAVVGRGEGVIPRQRGGGVGTGEVDRPEVAGRGVINVTANGTPATALAGASTAKVSAGARFNRAEALLETPLATARSGALSPLNSATSTDRGTVPAL